MADLEKAIFNLDVGIRFVENRGYGGIGAIMSDAISLLKAQQARIAELEAAQEPRVMELNDLQELQVYWVEDKNGSCIPETIMNLPMDWADTSGTSKEIWTIPVVKMGNGYAPVLAKINTMYGERWRCWTSRPTDEQREAVSWNE